MQLYLIMPALDCFSICVFQHIQEAELLNLIGWSGWRSLLAFQSQGQEIKEGEEDKTWEGGQAWAGCSLQDTVSVGSEPPAHPSGEPQSWRWAWMCRWRCRGEGWQGRNPRAKTRPSPSCRVRTDKRDLAHMDRISIVTVCSTEIKSLDQRNVCYLGIIKILVQLSNNKAFWWHMLATQFTENSFI